MGQVWGQRVSVLFGGCLDRVPAYASSGELKDPEARAESALALRDEGFRALKVRIHQHALDEGLTVIEAVRTAVGYSMDIMVDINQGWRMAGDLTPPLDIPAVRPFA